MEALEQRWDQRQDLCDEREFKVTSLLFSGLFTSSAHLVFNVYMVESAVPVKKKEDVPTQWLVQDAAILHENSASFRNSMFGP